MMTRRSNLRGLLCPHDRVEYVAEYGRREANEEELADEGVQPRVKGVPFSVGDISRL